MSESLKGALAVVAAATLWGTWKLWLRGPALDPAAQGALVLGFAGVVSTAFALAGRRQWPGVPRSEWFLLAVFGVTEAGNSGLYFRALSEGDTATAAITHYLAPVLVAVASPLLGEPMGRRARPAAALAFFATLALVGVGVDGPGTRAAAFEGGLSALFYAAGIFLSKRLTRSFRPWEIVGFHNVIAASIIALGSRTPLATAGRDEILLVVAGAALSATAAAGIYFYGLTRIPAARTAILSYMEPVSAALVGSLAFHESLGPLKATAMVAIVGAGVAVATEAAPPAAANELPARGIPSA